MDGQKSIRIVTAVLVAVLLTTSTAAGGVVLRVWDNGSEQDDQAEVRFDGVYLGMNDDPFERTWDLGDLAAGSHTLRLKHVVYVSETGTYGWSLSGGGLFANDDTATVSQGGQVLISVLANDTSTDVGEGASPQLQPNEEYTATIVVDAAGPAISIDNVGSPSHGTAVKEGTSIRYIPGPTACTSDVFNYTIRDGTGRTDTASVRVTIQNAPPAVEDDRATTPEGSPILIPVLDNDSDSGTLTLIAVGTPAHGTARIVGSELSYTPQVRYSGADRFSYTARDACGATAVAWVDVEITSTNHPPIANAGGFYQGTVGVPLTLDAGFSSDPDSGDRLEYRWDVDGDGQFDTDWLRTPTFVVTYSEPFLGEVLLEVRDVYRGTPTEARSTDTALIRVGLQAPQVVAVVFLDLNGDGKRSEDEIQGFVGLVVLFDEARRVITNDAGEAVFDGVGPGEHRVRIPEEAIAVLDARGIGLPTTTLVLDVQPGDPTWAFFPARPVAGKLTGRVFVDADGSGTPDEGESPVQGLRVTVDGGEERTTNPQGAFLFLGIRSGDHTVAVVGESYTWTGTVQIAGGTETQLAIPWPVEPKRGFLNVRVQAGTPDEE